MNNNCLPYKFPVIAMIDFESTTKIRTNRTIEFDWTAFWRSFGNEFRPLNRMKLCAMMKEIFGEHLYCFSAHELIVEIISGSFDDNK